VLFIDASELGYMVNRSSRAFTEEEISMIADTYHEWKRKPSQIPSPSPSLWEGDKKKNSLEVPLPLGEGFRERGYQDIKGFCKSAKLAEIEKHNFVLTPGRYMGIPDEVEDLVSFEDKMSDLTIALGEQMREGQLLDEEIRRQLLKVGFLVGEA